MTYKLKQNNSVKDTEYYVSVTSLGMEKTMMKKKSSLLWHLCCVKAETEENIKLGIKTLGSH